LGQGIVDASNSSGPTQTTGDFARMDGAGYRSTPYDGGVAWAEDIVARRTTMVKSSYESSGPEPYEVAPAQFASVLPPPAAYRGGAARVDASGNQVFNAQGMPMYDPVLAAAPIEPGVYNYEQHIQQNIDKVVATWNTYPSNVRLVDTEGNTMLNPATVKLVGDVGAVDSIGTVRQDMDQRLNALVENAEDAAVQDRSAWRYVAAQFFPRSTFGAVVAGAGGPIGGLVGKGIGAIALTKAAPLYTQAEVAAASRAAMAARMGVGGDQPLLLTYTPTTNTLAQIRRMPFPERWQAGERYVQELYGSPGQQHFAVPAGPVAGEEIVGTGGRFVDAPVPLPNGGTLAGEVKTYQSWRTINGQPAQQFVETSGKIEQQVLKDVWLRDNVPGYDPRWMFLDAPPSANLMQYLDKHMIDYLIYH
jgi:hypothetical protein